MKYNILRDENEQIQIATDDGTTITLLFSKEDNNNVEKSVLENLLLSYEKRMSI